MVKLTGPNDFWALLEGAAGDFSRLDDALARLDQEGLETFYGLHAILSDDALIEDALYYEATDTFLSEDGMEDFGWWVITQGKAFFDQLTSEALPLQEALAMHMQGKEPQVWVSGEGRTYRETNFSSLAIEAYEDRFGPWDWKREAELRRRAFQLRDREYSRR